MEARYLLAPCSVDCLRAGWGRAIKWQSPELHGKHPGGTNPMGRQGLDSQAPKCTSRGGRGAEEPCQQHSLPPVRTGIYSSGGFRWTGLVVPGTVLGAESRYTGFFDSSNKYHLYVHYELGEGKVLGTCVKPCAWWTSTAPE